MSPKQTLLRPELFETPVEISLTKTDRSIYQIIEDEYEADPLDPLVKETLQLLKDGVRRSKILTLSECEARGGRLYYHDRLVIPDNDELKMKILRAAHDSACSGHPGRGKTIELVQREYYWPACSTQFVDTSAAAISVAVRKLLARSATAF
ncbi:hypothetical protein PtrM4_054040 [Pyrenophora tritici-repentis]|uniref:Reverse transcriptase n=1 Tax=Pyrenophora tritici-repentis TaxID=45151 RepID=A0A834RKZ4_9PLEO|nr:hypothetical protein PtrM4_054040 [Pyrenophora tritici-repentis]KAI1509642.1 reverse transcriptase [Pyrenophora tritici-repentis]KAI1676709.1 reverse transcriptase [Pyrenophora tritici-repentis]